MADSRQDTAAEKRVELHLHTRFSKAAALDDPETLIAQAAAWGHPAIAITDHGCVQAFPDAWRAAKKHGIKLIYGMECSILDDAEGAPDTAHWSQNITILVQNKTGLKNLYEILSQSRQKGLAGDPIVPKRLLMAHREGLLLGSGCAEGALYDAVLRGSGDEELRRIGAFYDYFEIMPLENNRVLLEEGVVHDDEELREINRRILALGHESGKPVAATGDVHFLSPEQEIVRDILLDLKDDPHAEASLPLYFRTTDEMLEAFAYLGAENAYEVVVRTPAAIANSVESFELFPPGMHLPKIENAAEELNRLVYSTLRSIYGENPPRIIKDRVEQELNIILARGYDGIYMTMQKLVADSLEHGYLVGGRGGVGSSLVAFLSGITEINPLPPHYVCPKCHYTVFPDPADVGCGADLPDRCCPVCDMQLRRDGFDIPFETFLGFEGGKLPDIALNFSGEYVKQAHRYAQQLFGTDHVFRAGTIGTLSPEAAYGLIQDYTEKREIMLPEDKMQCLARGCAGVKYTTGYQPGGLVIVPRDMEVTDFCPVQDHDDEILTTHYAYHDMRGNLLKLDLLGHDDPTMIRMLEDRTCVDARLIRLDDPETMGIFRSPAPLGLPSNDPIIGKTGTIGIPEFGTPFARRLLDETQPKTFDALVRLSGFCHGAGVWHGNADELISSGTATISQTVSCRDDIMLNLICHGMDAHAAFEIMGSVYKGRVARSGFQSEWEYAMKAHGVPDWYIRSLEKIRYLFPRAHAASYVLLAFRIAWYKVHEPLAFYSAYFDQRRRKGAFDADLTIGSIAAVRDRIFRLQKRRRTEEENELLKTLEAVYEFRLRGFSLEQIREVSGADSTTETTAVFCQK